MRLNPEQISAITRIVGRLTGGTADVFLFGSRLDDCAKGGDIDLLLETAVPLSVNERARIKIELENRIGLPVDVVFHARDSTRTPFQRIARAKAVRLQAPA